MDAADLAYAILTDSAAAAGLQMLFVYPFL